MATGSLFQLPFPTDLEELWLSRNPLSGQVPTEFGNLAGLTFLDLRDTLLSGPLPESRPRGCSAPKVLSAALPLALQ